METGKTIGQLIDEARRASGAPTLAGHDIMDLMRFDENTRHMIVFDVLSHDSPVGFKGERMRLFLTDEGVQEGAGRAGEGPDQDSQSRECVFRPPALRPQRPGTLKGDLSL